jgi:hypothetical protein
MEVMPAQAAMDVIRLGTIAFSGTLSDFSSER